MLLQREEVLVEATGVMKKTNWLDKQVLTTWSLLPTIRRRLHLPLKPQQVVLLPSKDRKVLLPLLLLLLPLLLVLALEMMLVEMDFPLKKTRRISKLGMIISRKRQLKMLNCQLNYFLMVLLL